MAEAVIELINLTKIYGTQPAVDHLNLTVKTGEVFGLLGPNGAGKTTTILMILGLVEPTQGEAKVLGINATREPLKVKKWVGYLPEDVGFYDDMTGLENLILTARLNGMEDGKAHKTAEELLNRVGLKEAINKKVGAYSRGMRQRLGLADALIKKPKMIILDEPTLGLDPEGMREFLNLIRKLSKEEGITVLLSSHHLHQVQEICDRVGIFVKGRLIAQGTISELAKKLFFSELYTFEAVVAPNDDKIIEIISKIEGVTKVEREDKTLVINANKDVAPQIAAVVVNKGYELHRIQPKVYGLDDIYHCYFEGVQ
ncbi:MULTISPECIES: ABC transporter ATP-binding protein [Thermoanaerobacter]|uniref:ABC transporter ATP-binding protein n=1 Tax=Thermoanaerobacter TaxID=1754 RepID=UPI0004900CC0|nr:ABC transporter ATP-binding protein [Thermoanaerobacter thermocopriae]